MGRFIPFPFIVPVLGHRSALLLGSSSVSVTDSGHSRTSWLLGFCLLSETELFYVMVMSLRLLPQLANEKPFLYPTGERLMAQHVVRVTVFPLHVWRLPAPCSHSHNGLTTGFGYDNVRCNIIECIHFSLFCWHNLS